MRYVGPERERPVSGVTRLNRGETQDRPELGVQPRKSLQIHLHVRTLPHPRTASSQLHLHAWVEMHMVGTLCDSFRQGVPHHLAILP
jgi:hypothetical protein